MREDPNPTFPLQLDRNRRELFLRRLRHCALLRQVTVPPAVCSGGGGGCLKRGVALFDQHMIRRNGEKIPTHLVQKTSAMSYVTSEKAQAPRIL